MDDFEADLDDDLLADALEVAVSTGVVSAKCSHCLVTLLPEDHKFGACPRCGPFDEEVAPVYGVPS